MNVVLGILNRIYRIYKNYYRKIAIQRLMRRGLVVGKNFRMGDGAIIDPSHCWHISIGDDVRLARRAIIFAHDGSTSKFVNHMRIGKVTIGNRVFIGACSIILPGVSIGSNVIIGVGSVVTHDIPDGVVAAGNPAEVIGSIEDFVLRQKRGMEIYPLFGEEYRLENNVSMDMKTEMNNKMKDRYGYIILRFR